MLLLSTKSSGPCLKSFPGSSLLKVRGKVALIKAILSAIQREKRLSSAVEISDLATEIYTLVYSDPSLNTEPVDHQEIEAIRSMVEYLLRHEVFAADSPTQCVRFFVKKKLLQIENT